MYSVTVICPADFTYAYGECYKLTPSTALTWPDAVLACEQQSAYLAAPRSLSEARWVYDILSAAGKLVPGTDIWLGISDIAKEGIWQSVDDSEIVPFTFWASGQPDNANTEQNCGAMSVQGAGRWLDHKCDKPLQGLCRYNASVTTMLEGTLLLHMVLILHICRSIQEES